MAFVQTLKNQDKGLYWQCVDMARDGRSRAYIAGFVARRIADGEVRGNYKALDLLSSYNANTRDYNAGFAA